MLPSQVLNSGLKPSFCLSLPRSYSYKRGPPHMAKNYFFFTFQNKFPILILYFSKQVSDSASKHEEEKVLDLRLHSFHKGRIKSVRDCLLDLKAKLQTSPRITSPLACRTRTFMSSAIFLGLPISSRGHFSELVSPSLPLGLLCSHSPGSDDSSSNQKSKII